MRFFSCVVTVLMIVTLPAGAEAQTVKQDAGIAAGATTGAVAGAIVGGPVGAILGGVIGAVIGGAASAPQAIQPPKYVAVQGSPSDAGHGRFRSRSPAASTLAGSTIQPPYRVVSDKIVVVDRRTRRIVKVVQSRGARSGRVARMTRSRGTG